MMQRSFRMVFVALALVFPVRGLSANLLPHPEGKPAVDAIHASAEHLRIDGPPATHQVLHRLPWRHQAKGGFESHDTSGRVEGRPESQALDQGQGKRRVGPHAPRGTAPAASRRGRDAGKLGRVRVDQGRLRQEHRPGSRDDPAAQPGRVQQHDPRPGRRRLPARPTTSPPTTSATGSTTSATSSTLPPLLMEKYLAAAETIAEQAIMAGGSVAGRRSRRWDAQTLDAVGRRTAERGLPDPDLDRRDRRQPCLPPRRRPTSSGPAPIGHQAGPEPVAHGDPASTARRSRPST